jgi:hypothetical protein
MIDFTLRGQDRVVAIATRYGLDGPGIESWWWRDFPHPSRPALRFTQSPITMGTALITGVKMHGRGVQHPHSAPTLKKE